MRPRIHLILVVLPTSREGPAYTNPHYAALPEDYPYPARTTFTSDRRGRSCRTLNLENEYLFCRVLPDRCRDKRNGREVFHLNPVIKPGPIGLDWAGH